MKFDEVEFGAVALVLAETILGELRAKFTHQAIACHFGDDTGGGNGQTDAIAIDDRGLRQRKWRDWKSVDEHVLGYGGQPIEREPHRFVCSPQNIDLVDLDRIDDANAPKDIGARDQLIVNFLTQLRQQLFRVF